MLVVEAGGGDQPEIVQLSRAWWGLSYDNANSAACP